MTRRAGTPLFLRIFALMLVSVFAVQAISVGLALAAGPPPLPVYTARAVAAALSTGMDASGTLRVSIEPPPPPSPDPRAVPLARALGVIDDRIRVEDHRPRDGGGPPGESAATDDFMGRFAVALCLADGRWRIVRPARNPLMMWRRDALIWLGAALAVIAPFALLLARRAARPVALFAAAAERLGRDPHAPPLPEEGPPEIAEAAAAFNDMQRRLAHHVEDRTLMIGAIAHDMRTPLMRLSLRLEQAPESLREAVRGDVEEMETMIAAAAAFVRDAGRPIERRRLDLRTLIASVTDDLADEGEPVTLLDGAPVIVAGAPVALKSLVTNLVQNALRYAGSAEVQLTQAGGRAVIEVRDEGPGIPADELERVFDPFFRGERSRSRETGGFGLGLASARGIARAHGGDVTISNRTEGGAIARAVLPVEA